LAVGAPTELGEVGTIIGASEGSTATIVNVVAGIPSGRTGKGPADYGQRLSRST
jgi:hypothetical protein